MHARLCEGYSGLWDEMLGRGAGSSCGRYGAGDGPLLYSMLSPRVLSRTALIGGGETEIIALEGVSWRSFLFDEMLVYVVRPWWPETSVGGAFSNRTISESPSPP